MKRNQKGFGVVEGLLILIIVLLVGFIGYYVYHTRNNANSSYGNAANASNSSQVTTKSNKFVFKELGVQIDLPSSLKGLSYKVTNLSGIQYLDLTTPQLVNAFSSCNDGDNTSEAAFVSLDKKKGTFPTNRDVLNNDGQLLKQFDGFYVEAQYPNGITCSDTSKSDDFTSIFSSSKEAIHDAFQQATLIQ